MYVRTIATWEALTEKAPWLFCQRKLPYFECRGLSQFVEPFLRFPTVSLSAAVRPSWKSR